MVSLKRKFSGKQFQSAWYSSRKSEAQKKAKRYRDRGKLARVTKVMMTDARRRRVAMWVVWVR